MSRIIRSVVRVATLAGALMAPAAANAQVRLAPELAVADNVEFGVGARAFFPIGSVPNLEIGAAVDFYFPDNFDYYEFAGLVYYTFPQPDAPTILPRVGAGPVIGVTSFDTDSQDTSGASSTNVGLQLLGGIDFPLATVQPYVEFGLGIGDIPDFFVRGGVGFGL